MQPQLDKQGTFVLSVYMQDLFVSLLYTACVCMIFVFPTCMWHTRASSNASAGHRSCPVIGISGGPKSVCSGCNHMSSNPEV